MKSSDIRKKTEEECLKEVEKKRERLREISFSSASSKVKNSKEAANLRKDIARIITILKEKKYEK